MVRVERITKHLKRFDYKLYCDKDAEGTPRVCRQSIRNEIYDIDGVEILFARPAPHVIFYLTHNWKKSGHPVEWGVDNILNKLRFGDTHSRDLVSMIEKQDEGEKKTHERFLDNYTESFCKEYRREFAKATDGVRVANADKGKDSRRLEEKKIKYR